jgi:cytoskeleton protein RodZ
LTEPDTGIGAELLRAREARGLALSDVAQQLKFSARQLEALEQDRFDALPGGTFARGMVRSYARLLKLDPEPLLERIAGRLDAPPEVGKLAERYREPVPFSDGTRRSTFVYLGLSLGVLAIGGGVGYEWYRERSGAQRAFVAPAKAQPETRRAAAKSPRPPGAESVAATPPSPERKAAAPAADPGKTVPRGGPNRIVLRFDEEAWAEVRDSAERLLVSSLNPAGTERVVRGQPPFTLVIGNAQHVQVTYNDIPVDLQPYVKVEVARFTLK